MEDRTFFITHKHIDSALLGKSGEQKNLINSIRDTIDSETKRDYNIYEIFIPEKLFDELKKISIIGDELFSPMFIEEKRVFPNLEKIRISDSVEFDFTNIGNKKKEILISLVNNDIEKNLYIVAKVKCFKFEDGSRNESYKINSIEGRNENSNIFTGIFEFKINKETIIKNILELSNDFEEDLKVHLYTLRDDKIVHIEILITPFLKRLTDKLNFLEYIKEYIKRTRPDIIQYNKMYRLRLLNDNLPEQVTKDNIIEHLSPEIVYTIKPYEIALENITGKVLKNKYLLIDDDNYEQLGLEVPYSPITEDE